MEGSYPSIFLSPCYGVYFTMNQENHLEHDQRKVWSILDQYDYRDALIYNVKTLLTWKHQNLEPHFPLQCSNCHHSVPTYGHFEALEPVAHQMLYGQEYMVRLCRCGHELTVEVLEKRDNSHAGAKRRAFFEECVTLVDSKIMMPENRIRTALRSFFRQGAFIDFIRAN